MRESRTLKVSWSTAWLWVLVVLVLPNCKFNPVPVGPGDNLGKGPEPRSSAIFCDIEMVFGRHCASATEKAMGIRLAAAALALNTGKSSNIALDYSPAALADCGGEPKAIVFRDAFPDGTLTCLNCGSVIGTTSYPDVNAACVARCEDFFGVTNEDGSLTPDNPPDPSVATFCAAHAHASTNFPLDSCFEDACTSGGTPRDDFADPRRVPEAVVWQDLIGVSATGNNLTRTAATGAPPAPFNAGAASNQTFTKGDGYVEFSANEATLTHVCGLSTTAGADGDPSLADLKAAISLNFDGRFYVIENGALFPGPDINQSFGTYTAGQRFRVNVTDNFDGTATISYSRLTLPCVPGSACPAVLIHTSLNKPSYPLRVDASFREVGATLSDVRVVRIK